MSTIDCLTEIETALIAKSQEAATRTDLMEAIQHALEHAYALTRPGDLRRCVQRLAHVLAAHPLAEPKSVHDWETTLLWCLTQAGTNPAPKSSPRPRRGG